MQNSDYKLRFTASEWSRIEYELTRERGLWGPDNPSPLDKWMLDTVEGPFRMRKRMCRNHSFYRHYPYIGQSQVCLVYVHVLYCHTNSEYSVKSTGVVRADRVLVSLQSMYSKRTCMLALTLSLLTRSYSLPVAKQTRPDQTSTRVYSSRAKSGS